MDKLSGKQIIEAAKARWNAEADSLNQWDSLGLDEMIEICLADTMRENERCLEILQFYRWNIQRGVFHAGGNLASPFQDHYSCHGCNAAFEVTGMRSGQFPDNFSHADDCKYIEWEKLLKETGNG